MSPGETNLIDSVFAGSSEMAAHMRAHDWSSTALGPVQQWPQSLRTCVNIVVGSGYPMCIYWGPDYIFLYNDAYRPMTGTRHPWALGRGVREVYPEEWKILGPIFDRVTKHAQAESFLDDQLVPLKRNSYLEECYFAFSVSPIPDDGGHVGGALVTVLETTERVLEGRRRRLLRDLASRAAGSRTEEEIWHVSGEILAQDRSSLPFAFLYDYRPSVHQAYLVCRSVETGEALHPPVIDCGIENLWGFDPALTKDGALVDLGDRASCVPVPNWPAPPKDACVVPIRLGEYGEALGFLVAGIHPGRAFDDAYRQFVHRIAEQITIGLTSARAYERERQRAEALAELDRAKTAFFSNVSHEFRTPLTLMLGPLEEVQKEAIARLSPERQELLATVHRNGLRLLKLVNTLLDFSRIEAGSMQVSHQPTDLATFTREIASAFDSAMQNAGLRFSVECGPIAEPVYVDRDMWEKIVLNLLSNAYKFTFAGEIALTLEPVDGGVELRVRDTGVGIPEEDLDRVFERFHRIESARARTHEGTGIGLALVQELVKLHGGNVRVESTVGTGSTFIVTVPSGREQQPAERIHGARLPVSTKNRAEAYAAETQLWLGSESGTAVDGVELLQPLLATSTSEPNTAEKRELIILADDNADMCKYLTRLLGKRYEVHAVMDGHQALESVQQMHPALVLTDVMMPGLDGFGLLRAIRADSAIAGTPVILLSARAGEESRVEGLEAEADDYLIKPFAARELLARVAVHVKMANLRRETAEREERLRSEAELEREKLRGSEERLAETRRLYRELQQADAELQLQVELLQRLPVSACTLNPDGTPDFVNQVWLEFSGQTLDFVRSHPEAWMTAVHPEDREMASRAFWDGIRSGQGFAFETRSLRAKDGSYRWHLNQAVVLRDAEGNVLKFVGTSTDIDDQKRTEEALRASAGKLRRVIDTIPTLSWCNMADGPNEFLSRSWHEYTGLSPEEAHGWGWSAAFHPDDLPPLMTRWQEMLVSGESGEIEARIRRHDGVYRWFLIRAAPFRDESGAIIRWYGTSTDIEDRKRAEDAVLANERNLRLIIDTMPILAWAARPDGTADFFNRRWLDYTGLTELEVRGWGWATAFHPDDLGSVNDYWRSHILSGQPGEIEARLRRYDGSYRWFLLRANPLRDESDKIIQWYGTNTDIDGRKRAEEALRQAQSDLARVNRVTTMGELAASLAHELSQPISGAMTNANVGLRKLGSDNPNLDEVRGTFARIVRDAQRANKIIGRIRSQFEKGSPDQQTLDPNEILQDTIALLRDQAVRHNISVRTELATDLPQIVGDRVQLQQVVMNLIVNSIEAMREVDGIREIIIRSRRAENGEILVSVVDTGTGISTQLAEHIFDPFFTTKPHGTGMGLRISRSIIESHGGRLWAAGSPGRGATFHFSLPASIPGPS
jgi:PAS domain S-box-containing protein